MKNSCDDETLDFYKANGYTLEKVESLLMDAPYNLFQRYKVNKYRFAKQLYYSALPQKIYYRLLTLLALRESMRNEVRSTKDERQNENINNNNVELFHFIHPEIEEQEAYRIHNAMSRVVQYQKITEICAYLKELKDRRKVLLPESPNAVYIELRRIGMPSGEGYTEKRFRNCYMR
jgi:hypothetical protein